MSATASFSEQIQEAVGAWPGVVVDTGEIGETAFKVVRREIGHLHGDHAVHFSFPKSQWHQLRDAGRVEHHPVFPDKAGPAARRIETDEDVRDVIELFRLGYERVIARQGAAGDEALAS
jgi:hypothetical protein